MILVTKNGQNVTNIAYLSPTHFVSNICHQHEAKIDKIFETFSLGKKSLLQRVLFLIKSSLFHFYKKHNFVSLTQALDFSHSDSMHNIHLLGHFLLLSYFFHCWKHWMWISLVENKVILQLDSNCRLNSEKFQIFIFKPKLSFLRVNHKYAN